MTCCFANAVGVGLLHVIPPSKALIEAGSSVFYHGVAQPYDTRHTVTSSISHKGEHRHPSIPGQQLAKGIRILQSVHTHAFRQLHVPHHWQQMGAVEGGHYDCCSAALWHNDQYLLEVPPQNHDLTPKGQVLDVLTNCLHNVRHSATL